MDDSDINESCMLQTETNANQSVKTEDGQPKAVKFRGMMDDFGESNIRQNPHQILKQNRNQLR